MSCAASAMPLGVRPSASASLCHFVVDLTGCVLWQRPDPAMRRPAPSASPHCWRPLPNRLRSRSGEARLQSVHRSADRRRPRPGDFVQSSERWSFRARSARSDAVSRAAVAASFPASTVVLAVWRAAEAAPDAISCTVSPVELAIRRACSLRSLARLATESARGCSGILDGGRGRSGHSDALVLEFGRATRHRVTERGRPVLNRSGTCGDRRHLSASAVRLVWPATPDTAALTRSNWSDA